MNRDPARAQSPVTFEEFVKSIDRFNAAQPNASMLEAVRKYNHHVLDEFNEIRLLRGTRLLDVGASPHGYALERALRCGVRHYVGIGLDIHEDIWVESEWGRGTLGPGNAEELEFDDGSFDAILTCRRLSILRTSKRPYANFIAC